MASLGKDLALIRKDQNLSLDDINKATKIPVRILKSIENDSIFSDFEESSTYIRSYVRTYAKALSIDEKQVIYALDKRQKNEYSGSLRKSWKDDPDWAADEYEATESSEEDTSDQENDMIHDHSPEFQPSGETQSPSENLRSVESDTSGKRSEVRSVDWADMGRRFTPLRSTTPRTLIGIIVLVLIVAGGTFFYFYQGESSNSADTQQNTEQASPPTISTDSLELNISPVQDDSPMVVQDTGSANLQNETMQTLPDTLTMILYAAYGKLEPVRVYTDIMDNINPYWLEQGQALRFTFVNEIRIRGDFSNIILMLNGHVVQNFREQFYNPDTRLVEINRSYFEDDPKWLQPAPDSLDIDAPPPTSIQDRPTFN